MPLTISMPNWQGDHRRKTAKLALKSVFYSHHYQTLKTQLHVFILSSTIKLIHFGHGMQGGIIEIDILQLLFVLVRYQLTLLDYICKWHVIVERSRAPDPSSLCF